MGSTILSLLAAAGGLTVLPAAAAAQQVEEGYPRGSLAVAAIDRGDMAAAERLLAESPLRAEDPARLINLGYVYLRQGRESDAARVWRSALNAPRHRMVETMSGREIRTDQLALEALALLARAQIAAR